MTNFTIGRREAFQYTRSDLSLRLLGVFDRLIAWPSATLGYPGYRDEDVTGPGYCTWHEAGILYLMAKYGKPQRPLEIGCSVGWSTAHILSGLEDHVQLTCVDPFTETARGIGAYESAIFNKFQDYLTRAGLLDHVKLVVDESPACLSRIAPKEGWDFVFLDGWHFDGQPQRDLEGLLPHLAPNALVVCHDLHYNDVSDAGAWLVQQDWTFTGFFTPNKMFCFWRGARDDAPAWWGQFIRDYNTMMREGSDIVPLTHFALAEDPVVELPTKGRRSKKTTEASVAVE